MRVIYTNTCSLRWAEAEAEAETETYFRFTAVMGIYNAVGCGYGWISIDTLAEACTGLVACCRIRHRDPGSGIDLDCVLHGNICRNYTVRVGLTHLFLYNQVDADVICNMQHATQSHYTK
jgi:hypothetical protein